MAFSRRKHTATAPKGKAARRKKGERMKGKKVAVPVKTVKKLPPHPMHRGTPIPVGDFTIHVGGLRDLQSKDLEGFDLLIPLADHFIPFKNRVRYSILPYQMIDYGGTPADWHDFLDSVIEELRSGKKILAFCVGSHGRTGCFLASLISLLEPDTDDPIAAARSRHCDQAVETRGQAIAVFSLRGGELPEVYESEFPEPLPAPQLPQDAGLPINDLESDQHDGVFPWKQSSSRFDVALSGAKKGEEDGE